VKTKLDGFNQLDYLTGKSDKSAREVFFYYTQSTPSAVRYKNWKMYYTMMPSSGVSAITGAATTYAWTQVDNIKRDPFEQAVGENEKSATSQGGSLGSPSTAYVYDWNMLPIGQMLWEKELMSYIEFPPLQAPETFNLVQVLAEVKKARGIGHASD